MTTIEMQKVLKALEENEAMHETTRVDFEREVFDLRDFAASLRTEIQATREVCAIAASRIAIAAHLAGKYLPADKGGDEVRELFNTVEDALRAESVKR